MPWICSVVGIRKCFPILQAGSADMPLDIMVNGIVVDIAAFDSFCMLVISTIGYTVVDSPADIAQYSQ
jgi:hypothetical protein